MHFSSIALLQEEAVYKQSQSNKQHSDAVWKGLRTAIVHRFTLFFTRSLMTHFSFGSFVYKLEALKAFPV